MARERERELGKSVRAVKNDNDDGDLDMHKGFRLLIVTSGCLTGHSTRYWNGSWGLNFDNLTGTGASNLT